MVADASLRWVRAPQQDRSKRTLERLLDSAEEIIRARGVAALTVPAVAQAARSSVGSFYARFPDKDALLRTLHERACEQSVLTAEAALDPARWEGVKTTEVIRAFVGFAVHVFAERRPMMLAFSAELASDAGFAERRARTAAAIARALSRLLLPRRAEMRHPDPERAIAMALRMVTGVLEQRNGLDAAGVPEVAVADAVLVDELTRAVLRYLDVR
jgi:AcrR family transcriptional regulator